MTDRLAPAAIAGALYVGISGMVAGYDLAAVLLAGTLCLPLRKGLSRLPVLPWTSVRGLADRLDRCLRHSAPEEALASVVAVSRDALAVRGVAVEVADGETSVESGRAGAEAREVPLVWHGEQVGRLLVGPRRLPWACRDRALAALVPYAARLAHTLWTAGELKRAEELDVAARDEERRRLSRSLHDGLGRTLVAMARTIDLARGGPADCPHAADTLLRDLRRGMDDATDHVRVLLYGLPAGGFRTPSEREPAVALVPVAAGAQVGDDRVLQRGARGELVGRQVGVAEDELDRAPVVGLLGRVAGAEAALEGDDVGAFRQVVGELGVEEPGVAGGDGGLFVGEVAREEGAGAGQRVVAGGGRQRPGEVGNMQIQ
ncbi:hypothetical protein FR742_33590 [Nonomuraea sp. C10]|nr:hypothetical protein FR742_33590 [Nonomuraea sp. C10]